MRNRCRVSARVEVGVKVIPKGIWRRVQTQPTFWRMVDDEKFPGVAVVPSHVPRVIVQSKVTDAEGGMHADDVCGRGRFLS